VGETPRLVRRIEPDVVIARLSGALLDPCSSQIGGRLIRFLEDDLPVLTAVCRLRNAVEEILLTLADLQAAEAHIGNLRMAFAGSNGFKLAGELCLSSGVTALKCKPESSERYTFPSWPVA
jgi:hypothetical protein